ncbi:hypothetical protein SAMN05428975_3133 [Mucilaginibacter sp. OK268]|uniref:hypothetical protein n=1 Tax=Mucilaginibacter sp. OK268 TaxID=1881048 RepID=UPI00088D8F50|nr:hypothetical protein [Mucilaginibacter sp. OK268]SDP86476.1 hypothetical protein SAMN05428975_3133 [Mucilaginibacter sp. OK268]
MATNKNEQFVLTELWSKKLRDDLRSFYKTIYFGPPIFVLVNIIFCFAFQRGTNIDFWTLFIPITILSTIYCILIPQKAIKRYSSIIQVFEFKNESEMRVTLIDGRTLILPKPEFKDDFFKIDNTEKASKSVINNSDKSNYTIIPEFFTHPPIL